jgi:small-conductance mechanosensitive channel
MFIILIVLGVVIWFVNMYLTIKYVKYPWTFLIALPGATLAGLLIGYGIQLTWGT